MYDSWYQKFVPSNTLLLYVNLKNWYSLSVNYFAAQICVIYECFLHDLSLQGR